MSDIDTLDYFGVDSSSLLPDGIYKGSPFSLEWSVLSGFTKKGLHLIKSYHSTRSEVLGGNLISFIRKTQRATVFIELQG